MTLNAKKNKPRVNYNSTGEKIPEEKSEENSYQGNARKNIFNVYPSESQIFFLKAHTRNSSCLWRLYIGCEPAYRRAFMIGML